MSTTYDTEKPDRERCPKCHGLATRGGKQYGARCLECDTYTEWCECPDRSNAKPAVSNPVITARLRGDHDA